MLIETLTKIFRRDLNKLKSEIESYNNEHNLWVSNEYVSNSGGNLCLHIIGNLNHYIGAEFGNTGYKRQRDLEFSQINIPKTELISQIDEVILVVIESLSKISTTDLQKEYSRRVFEDTMTTEYFLVHLTAHLSYHLGQINYHRRFIDE